jgi:putative Ca2+/H+ antiporter (TMEM165/GDT1 family)
MNISVSRLIMGIVFLAAGIIFVVLAVSIHWTMIIYSVIFLALGVWIFLNKAEDKIENRKDVKERKYNK